MGGTDAGGGARYRGAILLGLFVGIPTTFLTGRLAPGEPLQTEAIAAASLKQKSAVVSVAPTAPLLQRMSAFRPV